MNRHMLWHNGHNVFVGHDKIMTFKASNPITEKRDHHCYNHLVHVIVCRCHSACHLHSARFNNDYRVTTAYDQNSGMDIFATFLNPFLR